MEIKINVPDYDISTGFKYQWEDGFRINLKEEDGIIVLTANKEGLLSLANHFLSLAQDNVPTRVHLHLDDMNALEVDSLEWVIEKT
jgi:hypothetical protein